MLLRGGEPYEIHAGVDGTDFDALPPAGQFSNLLRIFLAAARRPYLMRLIVSV